jgi:ligand-binding sensor domain-containing protein
VNRFLWLCLFVINAASSVAQVPFFKPYFLKSKNEKVEVNVILESSEGYIFVGTKSGLFKIDGHTNKLFGRSDSLAEDHVTALAADSLGTVWIGHKNGGISILRRNETTRFSPPEGLPNMAISDMLFDKDGVLWFSTLNDGIYFFYNERLFRVDDKEGLPDLYVYDLEVDANGNIWAGTDGGIAVCTRKENSVSIKVLTTKDGLPDNIVRKIKVDGRGNFWLATDEAGLVKFDPSSSSFTKPITGTWPHGPISDLVLEGQQIWTSVPSVGLMRFNTATTSREIYNALEKKELESVTCMLIDRQNNIWIGSKSGIQISRSGCIEPIDLKSNIGDQNIMAIAVDEQNTTWFSTKEGLFSLQKDVTGILRVKKISIGAIPPKATIISLYADRFDNLWIGLYGEGVIVMNIKTGKAMRFAKELNNGSVLNISGRGTEVWIATLEGAARFTRNNETWDVRNFGREDGMTSDYIYQVFNDSHNRIWFATDRAGIDMLDTKGFHHFEEGLKSKVILGFAEDALHQIWVNVQGEGLYQWKDNSFQKFQDSGRLRDINISVFLSDNLGNLVIGHPGGIDVYDVAKEKFIYLGDESGLEDFIPTLNCVARDLSGTISFGTENGIFKYSSKETLTGTRPVPHIVGFRQLGEREPVYDASFSYDENNLIVDYTGFWYPAPDDVCFQYKLEGYDKDWITSKFTFHLRASSASDCNGEEVVTYAFEISPPFWRRYWFYALCVIAIAVGSYTTFRYSERTLIAEKHVLERRVRERTRELQIKTEEIQAQNEEIQSQSEQISSINQNLEKLVHERTQELEKKNKALEDYYFINAHNLRAPVASVLGLIQLIRKVKLDEDGKEIVDHLESSATKLDNVVNSITRAIERGH